ncbi:MAG: hypothetical protein ABIP39_05295 [Polyangiaceae bacterium]
MSRVTSLAIGAAVFFWSVFASAENLGTWVRNAPLDQAIPLNIVPGEEVLVDGAVISSFDGSSYDAVAWFDLDGSGLRLGKPRERSLARVFEATGEDGPRCRAVGLASPCLAPRSRDLAHDRLLTEQEFVHTLHGAFEVTGSRTPVPTFTPGEERGARLGALSALLAMFAGVGLVARKKKNATPLGQVLLAAREARHRTRGDVTLSALRSQIDTLVARARELDRIHRACADRQKWLENVSGARHQKVTAWAATERAEADRIEADRTGALTELAQIASALRVIALSTQSSELKGATEDPLAAVAEELTLREDARREVERPYS